MAEIIPFRGWRYDTRLTEDLGKLIAPPYDVIDAPLRDTLFRLSPCNVAHITRAQRVEDAPGGPYADAGRLWAQWREQGIVKPDDSPRLYLYEQFFVVHGASRGPRSSPPSAWSRSAPSCGRTRTPWPRRAWTGWS